MDKKEASFILANIDRRVCDDELNEALDMAIKALEQEPKTDSWSIKDVADTFKKHGLIRVQEPSGDAISRQAVLDMVEDMTDQFGNKHRVVTEGMISLLPPVNPQPCEDAIDRAEAIKIASGYCHPANIANELAKLPSVNPQPCEDAISRENAIIRISWDFPTLEISKVKESLDKLPSVTPQPKTGHWISVSERLPELNRPLLVTTYHRVYYGHLISESGNYGYPVFRIHGLGDKNRDWAQETMSHEPYSLGRIDAWMYLDIPEPYKVEPQERRGEE